MIISSESYRRLVSRAPATIQAGRAQYLTSPQTAPLNVSEPHAHIFSEGAGRAFEPSAPTGMHDLDRSSELGTAYPATTANLLARYLVLREGEEHEFLVQATSVLCYVIKGSGRAFREDEVIEWTAGDAFLYPGGQPLLFEAPDSDAVLFVVTDEPFLASLGCVAPPDDDAKVQSAHYTAKTIAAQFEDMQAGSKTPTKQAILKLGSAPFERAGCVAPLMAAGIATLEPGAELPRLAVRPIVGLERNALFELKPLLQRDVDRAWKRACVLMCRDALDDRKRSHERVMTSMQASGRALERGAKAHEAMGSHLARCVVGFVEVDDQAAQRVVDGHFKYSSREWLDSQSQ